MQKFWFLSSIWFRNVSWCDAIKTSMCSKRNVVLSNVYTAINNYLSAKQRFEGACLSRGWYLLITVKTTKQLLFMNVYTYTWEVLKQTYTFHLKKEVYICSVNFSRTIYLNDFITYTLQIKYYMVKTFHVFHYGNRFFCPGCYSFSEQKITKLKCFSTRNMELSNIVSSNHS